MWGGGVMRTIQSIRRVKEWALNLTRALVVVLCAACIGGGDSGFTSPPAPITCEQNPDRTQCPSTGNLQVTVTGVPSDVPSPLIELYFYPAEGSDSWGPEAIMQVVIDGSRTFADLASGRYSGYALPTSNNPTVLHSAHPNWFNVMVVPGKTAQATFAFSPDTLGAIEFTVQGLPSAGTGLMMQGPNGWRTQPVHEGLNAVPHLDAGAWMLTLPNVSNFVPRSRTIQTTVTTGSITPGPTVAYTATGILALEVAGLPSGVRAEGTITGPDGFTSDLRTFVLARVVVGTYTVTPTNVSSGGVTYTSSAQTALVTRSAATRLTVNYIVANP
jgi:hypothetical protein